MKNIVRTTLLIFVITVLGACTGKNFVRPSADLIQFGRTTEDQVIAVMGNPQYSQSGKMHGGKNVKMLFYGYDAKPGIVQFGKTAAFFFTDGVLVGHVFESDFPDESTDFDLTKVGNIVENVSTRKDVESILGKPSGESIYPTVEDPEGRRLVYRFTGQNVNKDARFEIDKEGIVRHITVELEQ